MRKRVLAAPAALLLGPLAVCALGVVPVEQIEGYENQPNPNTGYYPYAAVNFWNNPTVYIDDGGNGGQFNGLTFHADPASGTYETISGHATTVGDFFYGSNTVATGYVTDVYAAEADVFFLNVLGVPVSGGSTGVGTVPGTFAGDAKVINNSYVLEEDSFGAYQNDIRRLDFMIDQADAVWVAGAVTNGSQFTGTAYLSWSNYNSLAVSGVQESLQSFNPAGSPGKTHADLAMPTAEASFGTAMVSSYATGLSGRAQAANQADAQHGVVIRSLLMAGADKNFSHPASNSPTGALDPVNGAGIPDFSNSLSMLQAGEKPLLSVNDNIIAGSPVTTQKGWAYGNISSGTRSVVLIDSINAITGLTASLNWNVTSSQPDADHIDTSDAAVIFPHLTLQVLPVNFSSGHYVLGNPLSNTDFSSNVTNDNVQYLWSTSALPAGSYAFVIGGDSTYSPAVGFSYALSGSFASSWNSSTGGSWTDASAWTNGIPDGQAAQVNFVSSPGITSPGTITLDGDRTVGQITFDNANSYTIAAGSGGTLTIDDTGDSSGIASPQVNVLSGNHTISADISFAAGITVTTASATQLTIGGAIGGNGVLTKAGGGTLVLGASSTTGVLTRTVPISIAAGSVVLENSPVGAKQLLISPSFSIAGASGQWAGKLDLNNNDLDLPSGDLATTIDQISQGFANGSWNGSGGILSTTAANDSAHLTALGVIQNNQDGSALFTSSNLFDGTVPGEADILVKYTYFGDANLDGVVDGSDYSRIDSGFLTGASGWFNGDFNYDGVVNGSDYTLIDNAFNRQDESTQTQTARSTANVAVVPEPGLLGIFIGVNTILSRRRRVQTP